MRPRRFLSALMFTCELVEVVVVFQWLWSFVLRPPQNTNNTLSWFQLTELTLVTTKTSASSKFGRLGTRGTQTVHVPVPVHPSHLVGYLCTCTYRGANCERANRENDPSLSLAGKKGTNGVLLRAADVLCVACRSGRRTMAAQRLYRPSCILVDKSSKGARKLFRRLGLLMKNEDACATFDVKSFQLNHSKQFKVRRERREDLEPNFRQVLACRRHHRISAELNACWAKENLPFAFILVRA